MIRGFRGWSKKQQKWVLGGWCVVCGIDYIVVENKGVKKGEESVSLVEVDPWSIGEYIGTEDMYCEKIYSGDNVKGEIRSRQGMKRECEFVVRAMNCSSRGHYYKLVPITKIGDDYNIYPDYDEVEIIGKEYENTELLKK